MDIVSQHSQHTFHVVFLLIINFYSLSLTPNGPKFSFYNGAVRVLREERVITTEISLALEPSDFRVFC